VSNNAQQANITFGITRKSLEAVLIHACPHCEAPGVFQWDTRTHELWPGCWRPSEKGRPVGRICPNCGHVRERDKDLGELTASMPRWLWRSILGLKWCVIKLTTLYRKQENLHA